MKDNQEEDISWLFLWGATILYIAILCMSFAGLAVTKPTVGAAFLDFTKDYGSLLAGIPVLIGVIIAVEQLKASRSYNYQSLREVRLPRTLATMEMKSRITAIFDKCDSDDPTKKLLIPTTDEQYFHYQKYLSPIITDNLKQLETLYLDTYSIKIGNDDISRLIIDYEYTKVKEKALGFIEILDNYDKGIEKFITINAS